MGTIPSLARKQTQSALRRLSARLAFAAKHPEEPEAIHDLRVAIRRFTQCLRTFEHLFDPDIVKRFKRRLGKLMEACGEVRDCDIAQRLLRVAGLRPEDAAYAALKSRRREAELRLVENLARKRWVRFAERNPIRFRPQPLASDHWNLKRSVESSAAKLLQTMCAELFMAGNAAVAASGDYETLHQFRLRAKRFRYTLELFQGIYPTGTERILGVLRELQNRLGDVNDCLTTLAILEKNRVAKRLIRKVLVEREQAFRNLWHDTFSEKQCRLWCRWLGRPGAKKQSSLSSNIH